MIVTIKGNLLDVHRGIILHQVNMLGMFGAGIAKEIKERYPQAYKDYIKAFNKKQVKLGEVISSKISSDLTILHCVGQNNCGRSKNVCYTDYEALKECIKKVVLIANFRFGDKVPICFPLLGCGLSGGSWEIVSDIIDKGIPDFYEKRLYII